MHKIKRDPCPDERIGGTICNALDEYVWKIDENYSYELIQTNTDFRRVTGYTFKMTSQKWLNETYWEHTKGAVSKLSIAPVFAAKLRASNFEVQSRIKLKSDLKTTQDKRGSIMSQFGYHTNQTTNSGFIFYIVGLFQIGYLIPLFRI